MLLLERIDRQYGPVARLSEPVVTHVNHDDWRYYERALARRGRGVGQLWDLDPETAAALFPVPAWARRVRGSRGLSFVARLVLRGHRRVCTIGLRVGRVVGSQGLLEAAGAGAVSVIIRRAFLDR